MTWPTTEYEFRVRDAWIQFWEQAERIDPPLPRTRSFGQAANERIWNMRLLTLGISHLMAHESGDFLDSYIETILKDRYEPKGIHDAAAAQFLKEHLERQNELAEQ